MPPPAFNNRILQAFIAGHGSWYSACSNHLLSLSSLGDTLSVSALISLATFWPRTWCANFPWGGRVGNLPTNFGVSGSFRSRLIDQRRPTLVRRTALPVNLDLWTRRTRRFVDDTALRVSSVYQVRRPSRSEDIAHLRCEHYATCDLDLWPLTIWPLNSPSPSVCVFVCLSEA